MPNIVVSEVKEDTTLWYDGCQALGLTNSWLGFVTNPNFKKIILLPLL
jgi:hypothetical protein